MAIDVGIWYQDKRAVQASADAAALAGASVLPASWATAQTAASNVFNSNKKSGDTATIINASNLTANDSVTVTVTRTQPSFFAKLLGKNNITIKASARATVESITTLAPSFDVMPWGVPQNDYVFSQEYSLYTNSPNNANNGALSLPYQSGINCPVPNGANLYRDEIAGVLNPCSIPLGEVLDENHDLETVQPDRPAGSRLDHGHVHHQGQLDPAAGADSHRHQPAGREHLAAQCALSGARRGIRLVRDRELRPAEQPQLLREQ
jgi:hypothetical protein